MNELNDLCTKGRAHEFFFSFPAKSIFSREKLRPPTASIYLVLSWAGFSSWYHLYLSSLSLWEGAFSSVTHVWSTSILSIIIEGVCGLKTVVCYEGCSLVFHSVCSPVGSSGVPAGWWKFSVSFMWSIHRHLLILILGVDLFSSSLLSVSSQSI